jgi:hypothetical protein
MTFSEALELAQKLNADPEDDWGYVAALMDYDAAHVICYDEKGNLMGYLKGNWRLYHG